MLYDTPLTEIGGKFVEMNLGQLDRNIGFLSTLVSEYGHDDLALSFKPPSFDT